MFERYTEKARRVIFFARYEASQFGSPYIETEHLLLGLLREDKALANRFLRSHAAVDSIRKQIEGHATIREKVSTSVDLPLSNECKRILAYAAEEAEMTESLAIVAPNICCSASCARKNASLRKSLQERGLHLTAIREETVKIGGRSPGSLAKASKETPLLSEFTGPTQAAMDGILDPLVGRDGEIDRVIQILCRRTKQSGF